VRIAYFDEAGPASVGGILVHGDTEWQPLEHACNKIIATFVPEELWKTFHFHGMHLHSGHKSYKGLLSPEARFQILREVVGLIAHFKLPVSYGAITRSKLREMWVHSSVQQRVHLAHQFALGLCATGFQGWFNRGPFGDEVAICVADRNETKNRQLSLKQTFQVGRLVGAVPGDALTTLINFIDALHFAALNESFGLQLADIATFVIKRHLMDKPDPDGLYRTLEPCLVCNPESALWPIPTETK
jgi:hypothetical protein